MWSAVEWWLKAIGMNWASGLFRIWIVISVLWVALQLASERPLGKITEVIKANAELGVNRGIYTSEFLETAAQNASRQGNFDDADWLRQLGAELLVNGRYETIERQRFDRAVHSLASMLQLMLVPPAVLGFILFGIWWSISGFRSGKRD